MLHKLQRPSQTADASYRIRLTRKPGEFSGRGRVTEKS